MAAKKAAPTNTKPATKTAPNTEEPAVLALPSQWPGAFKAYKYSKQAVKLNANAIVGWLIIEVLLSVIISGLGRSGGGAPSRGLFEVVSYLITPLFSAIITKTLIAGVRRQPVSFEAAFSRGASYWLNNLVLSILVTVTVIISLLLLIIPFFFVWPRLTLATYFLVDKNFGPVEAYKASWKATKGYVGRLYGILGAQIAMGLLALTVIGIPFAIYFLIMYSAAHAVIYELILGSPAGGDQASVEV
ncbi:MAG TPA: hypothetical protein VHC21_03875 [Candidatus Saccharimonadales bacterium]|nr:hypothetical protein [Candidatus Saccharimonadales bacterium]